MKTYAWAFVAFLWALWPPYSLSELIVNVSRNRTHPFDGTVRQIITGNSSTELVSLEYKESDGTIVTLLTDFRTNVQITRLVVAGEEELNEPRAQTLCFVSSFTNDLIPPEAVMKLRQKNPGTIRVADEDLGEIVQDSSLKLFSKSVALISYQLPKMCRGDVLSSHHEIANILEGRNNNKDKVQDVSQNDLAYDELQRCYTLPYNEDRRKSCICARSVNLNWIPCALKYCRQKDGDGQMVEQRCGIKTCRKCLTFRYRAKSKLHCLWDEQ